MLILGIESSCDDTSVAIVRDGHQILANIVASQDEYHCKFGGVVPEIAARKHLEHILPTLQLCLENAEVHPEQLDAVAVTHRPGLVGSLIVGLTAAKSLSYLFKKPIIGVNHLEAHAFSSCLSGLEYGKPHIALVASGGHTSLIEFGESKVNLIGRTVDDAAGEAFDKVAKFMTLGYPGGPIIDRLAKTGSGKHTRFPRPMIDQANFNFSFSGLKTAVIYHLTAHPDAKQEDIAASFQEAVVDVLARKTLSAAQKLGYNTISVAGGVAANSYLRQEFRARCETLNLEFHTPDLRFCTDNAAMVAGLGYHKLRNNHVSDLSLGVHADGGFK